MKQYDIIIVGGGGGTKFVQPALKLGLSVAIIEKEDLGGTCLNRGCIPSKMLIHPANTLEAARDMTKYAISGGGDYTIDFKELVERVSKTVDADSAGISESYTTSDAIDFYHAKAKFVDDKIIEVEDKSEKIQMTAEAIFVVVGSRPLIPNIPGLAGCAPGGEDMPYMTSREALRNTELPERLAVIGGGYIGCELGHVYATFGSDTTFFVRGRYLDREDQDIREIYTEAFSKKHTTVYGTKDLSVTYEGKEFMLSGVDPDGKSVEYKSDALLVATGVVPNTDDLGLENTTIKIDKKGYIQVDDYLQTDVEGVFALGDCIGRYLFRHSVNFEAEYLVENLFENPDEMSPIAYPPMPHAVFTSPEIAGVGLTEDEAKEKNLDYLAVSHEYKSSAQGMARLPEHGLVKLLFEKSSKKLIGAHIIGDEAATMSHQLIYAMTMDATVDDLLGMIYIHPALPEIVRNAARKAKVELS